MLETTLSNIVVLKGDRLIVRRAPLVQETTGSILIPENHRADAKMDRKQAWRAELVKVGDKVDLTEFEKYGDKVSIGSYVYLDPVAIDCQHFTEGKETYFFVREEDVMGVEVSDAVTA